MRQISVSKSYAAQVDDTDFARVVAHKWRPNVRRNPDGTARTIYARTNVPTDRGKFKTQTLHRFILGVSDPSIEVFHKDGNGLNCQRNNLHIAPKVSKAA